MNSDTEYYQPVTPLPYSRIEPWSLAPWLTGIIVALVIFVILIPALCSACYHYYSYKVNHHLKIAAIRSQLFVYNGRKTADKCIGGKFEFFFKK